MRIQIVCKSGTTSDRVIEDIDNLPIQNFTQKDFVIISADTNEFLREMYIPISDISITKIIECNNTNIILLSTPSFQSEYI